MIWIKWQKEHKIVLRIGRMDMENVHFVTRSYSGRLLVELIVVDDTTRMDVEG
jgi:hypothetical protein